MALYCSTWMLICGISVGNMSLYLHINTSKNKHMLPSIVANGRADAIAKPDANQLNLVASFRWDGAVR